MLGVWGYSGGCLFATWECGTRYMRLIIIANTNLRTENSRALRS